MYIQRRPEFPGWNVAFNRIDLPIDKPSVAEEHIIVNGFPFCFAIQFLMHHYPHVEQLVSSQIGREFSLHLSVSAQN